jgi:hypothetical protein
VSDTKLTLEDRSKFESLLAEYANAEMDCVRAVGRRHDALHRVLDYVNTRVALADSGAFGAVPPCPPPPLHYYSESCACVACCEERSRKVPVGTTKAVPFTSNELEAGAMHYKHDAPVDCCQCGVCCTARALASIGKPSETDFDPGPPPMGQYSGN